MFGFSKKSFGLDISDDSLKLVTLLRRGKEMRILKKVRLELGEKIIENGKILDKEKLKKIIIQAFKEIDCSGLTKDAIFAGLPENLVYTHVFNLKKNNENIIKTEVADVLDNCVPLDSSSRTSTYALISESGVNFRVLALAVDTDEMIKWRQIFDELGLSQIKFTTPAFSAYRGLTLGNPVGLNGVVDIGESQMTVSFFDKFGLKFSFSSLIAGKIIDETIASESKFELIKAKREKETRGFKSRSKLFVIGLKYGLDKISDEISRVLNFCENQCGLRADKIIIIGGNGCVPGLIEYLLKDLNLNIGAGHSSILADNEGLIFIEAIGLAIIALEQNIGGQLPYFDKNNISKQTLLQVVDCNQVNRAIISSAAPVKETEPVIDENNRLRKRKFLLLFIIIFGAIMLVVAFWYRQSNDDKSRVAVSSLLVNYSQASILNINIPIVVSGRVAGSTQISGKLISDAFELVGNLNEAVAVSQRKNLAELTNNDKLWGEPILATTTTVSSSEFGKINVSNRYKVIWLVYNNKEVMNYITKKIDSLLAKNNIKYAISNIEKVDITPTNNAGVYVLSNKVTVASNVKIGVIGN